MAQPAPNPTAKPTTDDGGMFGKIAVQLGFISSTQLEEAVKAQQAAAKAGLHKRLGDILMKKGYLTPDQLQKVLKGQKVATKKIGNYELVSKLGEGGMGAVFKAKQTGIERLVALKILAPKMAKSKDFRERFFREARAVAKLNHPHIVSGIDVGTADGYYYFAMEFVDGESLGQYMMRRGGKLDEVTTLDLIKQVAMALQHAHDNNLLHRDVKPDNVLLDLHTMQAKLADLGLARTAESAADDAALTQAGQAVGTPFYISPEQARGLSDLTPATDLYSLGASMFHLLTGQVPFDGATAAVIMTRHLTDPVPSVRALNPNITSGCDRIIQKLMQKDPRDRYKSAELLIEDIERLQTGAVEVVKTSAKPSKSSKAPAPVVTPPNAEKPVRETRERDREREREVRERDREPREREAPSPVNIPSVALRPRRRRSSNEAGLGVALVFVIILGGLLYFFGPLGKKQPRPVNNPSNGTTTVKKDPAPPVINDGPLAEPGMPANLQVAEDGSRVYKCDFESGTFQNFEVDPAVGKASYTPKVFPDSTGKNHVLRMGHIRPIGYLYQSSGAMIRLVLAPDAKLSHNATLSFSVHFASSKDTMPPLRVWWDHVHAGEPRSTSGFEFKKSEFRAGWDRVTVTLGKAPTKLQSREPADAPQYIAVLAGNADEQLDVFLDDVELIDPGEGAASATTETPAPAEQPQTPARPKRDPVAQPKAQPAQPKEAPVAPPPKAPKGEGAGDALRLAL